MRKKWHFSVKRSQFNGHEVKSSDYLKILGVTIDSKLTFSEHIREICKKIGCKVGVLLRLRNLIPWSAKLQLLYKSNNYSSPPTRDEYRNLPSV